MDTQGDCFQRAYDELRDGDVDSATMGRAIAEVTVMKPNAIPSTFKNWSKTSPPRTAG